MYQHFFISYDISKFNDNGDERKKNKKTKGLNLHIFTSQDSNVLLSAHLYDLKSIETITKLLTKVL